MHFNNFNNKAREHMYHTFANQNKNSQESYQNRRGNQNRSPSPLTKNKMVPSSSSKQAITTLKQQNFNSNRRQITDIMQLSQNFYKKIVENIRLCEEMSHKNVPQKCLLHNNTYSLYCQNDKKTLCVNCIYQNQSHRKHTIIPINQAVKELQRDIKNNKEKASTQIGELNKLLKSRQQNQQKMEKQFAYIISKLERNYTNLHQILVRKEKEQINQLNYLKEKIKYENAAFNTELNKIICYAVERLSVKSSDENKYKDILLEHRVSSIMVNMKRQIFHSSSYNNFNEFLYGRTLDSSIVSSQHFGNVGEFLGKSLQLFLNQKDAKKSLHSSPENDKKRKSNQISGKPNSKSKQKNFHKRTFSGQTPDKYAKIGKKQIKDRSHSSKSIIKTREQIKTPQRKNTLSAGKRQQQMQTKIKNSTISMNKNTAIHQSKSPSRAQKSKTPSKAKLSSKNQQSKKKKNQQKISKKVQIKRND